MTFEDILQHASPEELQDFLRHYKMNAPDFENRFLAFFSYKNPQIPVLYIAHDTVRQVIARHDDRGYMVYSQVRDFATDIQLIVQDAQAALERQHLPTAADIAQAICDELIEILGHVDDSGASVSMVIEDALALLQRVGNQAACPKELRLRLLSWVGQRLRSHVWNHIGCYRDELLSVAAAAALPCCPEQFLQLLDDLAAEDSNHSLNGRYDSILIIHRVSFLISLGRGAEAEEIIQDHPYIDRLRALHIEWTIQLGNYALAKELIGREIIRTEESARFNDLRQWLKVLLEIAEREDNLADKRKYACQLAFGGSYTDMTHYRYWKSLFAAQEWPRVLEEQITAVLRKVTQLGENSDNSYHFRRLAEVYIEEERWASLLQALLACQQAHSLETSLPHLGPRYPREMLAASLKVLQSMSEQSQKRSHYKRLADQVIEVKKHIPGSQSTIDEQIIMWIRINNRRPAMREELQRALQFFATS